LAAQKSLKIGHFRISDHAGLCVAIESRAAQCFAANTGRSQILRMQMASQEQRREQITVPIDADLRQRLELAAERDHRTIASYVRHVVVRALAGFGEAQRDSEQSNGGRT
jgi:hypothetical protein